MTLIAPSVDTICIIAHGPGVAGQRAARQVYSDGALFVAEHDGLPPGFWDRHPLVERTEEDAPQTSAHATRIWPVHYEFPDQTSELPRSLDRAPDVVLHGWLNPGQGFWAAYPGVEALDYVWSMGDEGFPDAWGAKIWLKR
jgi:hypothetical protein